MDEQLTHDDFVSFVGQYFAVEGRDQVLFLRSVDLLAGSAAPGASRVPFTLKFEGAAGGALPARLYHIAARDGRSFHLHLMPVQTHARDRQDYQAVFN